MKVRKSIPNPCQRKGEDNQHLLKECECRAECKTLGGYLNPDSKGTIAFKKQNKSKKISKKFQFNGCQQIEGLLIDNYELRYDGREVTGLEVLFNGIEQIQDYRGSTHFYTYTSNDVNDHSTNIENAMIHKHMKKNHLYQSSDPNGAEASKTRFLTEMPKELQINTNKMAEIWSSKPKDILDAMLRTCWSKGVFETGTEELVRTAYIMMKHIEIPEVIEQIWPKFDKEKFKAHEKLVWALVKKNMPVWAKKFKGFLKALTKEQKEAIELEWFYPDDEKPTQADLAATLGRYFQMLWMS